MYKKTTLLFLIVASFLKANAAILLVNNTPGGPGQYTQINDAVAAAANGDTIYVSGSATNYADATINKNITLVGPGTFADKQLQLKARIAVLGLASNISNVKIMGLTLGLIGGSNTSNINNLDISFNNFESGYWYSFVGITNCTNWNIHNNVFSTGPSGFWSDACKISSNGGCVNFVIQNNIFHSNFTDQWIKSFNIPNGVIIHNTFISSASNALQIFAGLSSIAIQNNIFYNCDPTLGVSSSTYNNNISFSNGAPLSIMGGSNIDNVDPLFVNAIAGNGFSISNNYNLQTLSVANNAASDGTDIGYYGSLVSNELSPRGEVYNVPVIRNMIIQNFNVPQNGNVNVKVRSTKSRTN